MEEVRNLSRLFALQVQNITGDSKNVTFTCEGTEHRVKKGHIKTTMLNLAAESLEKAQLREYCDKILDQPVSHNFAPYCQAMLYLATKDIHEKALVLKKKKLVFEPSFSVDEEYSIKHVCSRYAKLQQHDVTNKAMKALLASKSVLDFLDSIHKEILGEEIVIVEDQGEDKSTDLHSDDSLSEEEEETPPPPKRRATQKPQAASVPARSAPVLTSLDQKIIQDMDTMEQKERLVVSRPYIFSTEETIQNDDPLPKLIEALAGVDVPMGYKLLQQRVHVYTETKEYVSEVTLERAILYTTMRKKAMDLLSKTC